MGSRKDYEAIYHSFFPLLTGVVILLIGFFYGRFTMKNSYDPNRAVNNIDTIYYGDTAYVVRLYIDSVFEVDEYNEPVKQIERSK